MLYKLFQTPLAALNSPPYQETHNSSWGTQGAAWTIHIGLTLSYFHRSVAVLPSNSPQVPLCPSQSPHREGASPSEGTARSSALPHGCQSLSVSPFLLLFHLTWLRGDFSYPFRCKRSCASFQQVSSENCSICRCILDVLILVREDELNILLFFPPQT